METYNKVVEQYELQAVYDQLDPTKQTKAIELSKDTH